MKVGIIGGTGPAGQAVAVRLAHSGHEVVVGSRNKERSTAVVAELTQTWGDRTLSLVAGTNEESAASDIAILATPWEGAVSTSLGLSEPLRNKVLISMVNALARVGNEFQALVASRGSIAASVQGVLPLTMVTTAFQHLPAQELGAIDHELVADVMICSDTEDGFLQTAELVGGVAGLRAIFSGSLASANAVEALTAVLLNINIHYKTHASLRLSGLNEIG